MPLDKTTMIVVSLSMDIILTLCMVLLCNLMRRPRALVFWTGTFVAFTAGLALSMFAPANDPHVLVVANALVSVANALLLVGIAAHFAKSIRLRWPIALVVAYFVTLYGVLVVRPSVRLEDALFATHSVVWDIWIIGYLVRNTPAELRASSLFTASIFFADLMFYVVFGLIALGGSSTGMEGLTGKLHATNYLFGTLSTMLLAFGLMLMQAEKMLGELRYVANRDSLTGLVNRAAFGRRARRAIDACNASNKPYVLMLCDLDYFKKINDRWGHAGGDAALRHFSALMDGWGLPSDALYSRYGGEEFAVLLPGSNRVRAAALAERLRAMTQETPAEFNGGRIPLTVSIGAVVVHGFAYEMATHEADVALYAAKNAGRNRVVFGPDVDSSMASDTSRV